VAKRVRLGQLLTEAGHLTPKQLDQALAQQKQTGERLGELVVSLGFASPEHIASALARQLNLRFIRLDDTVVHEAPLERVPEVAAQRYRVVPIGEEEGGLILGMVDPLDVFAIDDLRRLTGLPIRPAIITADDFYLILNRYPAADQSVAEILEQVRPTELLDAEASLDTLRAVAQHAPIVRLANQIITQAIRMGASDIHVEPQEPHVRVRYRIDGTLHPMLTVPRHVQAALISRYKIMANMNIAERRLPQDGRIELRIEGRDIDFRVSTIPVVWGEKVVMRILDRSGAFVSLERLGLTPEDHERFEPITARPHGIIFLTGPTGSGKTTTLYAILNRLNRTEVNIITIEDPVEYQIPGITQVPLNPKAGVTFASGLRAFLRQDPDIIMVGEVRDEETARIAVHAALTGHLVLSTLHTNDAPGAMTRLLDMGIEPFLVASSMVGVIAQRLVRVLCPKCKQPYKPTKRFLHTVGFDKVGGTPTFYRPVGCGFCNQIGYKGRTGVFEIMPVDDTIKTLIIKRAPSTEIKAAAIAGGMRTLQQAGLAKALAGITSFEEVMRVVFVED